MEKLKHSYTTNFVYNHSWMQSDFFELFNKPWGSTPFMDGLFVYDGSDIENLEPYFKNTDNSTQILEMAFHRWTYAHYELPYNRFTSSYITNVGGELTDGSYIFTINTKTSEAVIYVPVWFFRTCKYPSGVIETPYFGETPKPVPSEFSGFGGQKDFFDICQKYKINNVCVVFVVDNLGIGIVSGVYSNIGESEDACILMFADIEVMRNRIVNVYVKHYDILKEFIRMYSNMFYPRNQEPKLGKSLLGVIFNTSDNTNRIIEWKVFDDAYSKYRYVNTVLNGELGAYYSLINNSFVNCPYPNEKWILLLNSDNYDEKEGLFAFRYPEEVVLINAMGQDKFFQFVSFITDGVSQIPYYVTDPEKPLFMTLDFKIVQNLFSDLFDNKESS